MDWISLWFQAFVENQRVDHGYGGGGHPEDMDGDVIGDGKLLQWVERE